MKKAGIISTPPRRAQDSPHQNYKKSLLLNTRHLHSQAIRIQLHTPQRTNPQSKWQGHVHVSRTFAIDVWRGNQRKNPTTDRSSFDSNPRRKGRCGIRQSTKARHHRPPQRQKEQLRNRCSIPQSSLRSPNTTRPGTLSRSLVCTARLESAR